MPRSLNVFLLGVAAAGMLAAQSAVEYTLGAGRAGAPAGIGKSAGKAFERLGKRLEDASGGAKSGSQIITVPKAPGPDQAKPAQAFEDPKGIKQGMPAEELVRRFGQPAFKTTSPDGATEQVYSNKEAEFTVIMKDGKVDSVTRAPKPQQAGVVILQ